MDAHLRDVLACPKCKKGVIDEKMFLVCPRCKLAFPILDGDVPDMLLDDAWPLEKAKKSSFRHEVKL